MTSNLICQIHRNGGATPHLSFFTLTFVLNPTVKCYVCSCLCKTLVYEWSLNVFRSDNAAYVVCIREVGERWRRHAGDGAPLVSHMLKGFFDIQLSRILMVFPADRNKLHHFVLSSSYRLFNNLPQGLNDNKQHYCTHPSQ